MDAAMLIMAVSLGFLGSMHCVGMCGGFAVALTMGRPRMPWLGLSLYQAGRVLGYVVLGALVGAAGQGMEALGGLGAQRALAVMAGIVMVGFGLSLLGWLPDALIEFGGRGAQWLGARVAWLRRRSEAGWENGGGWLLLGLLNGFLPCGLVYAALAMAMGTARVSEAVLIMASFGAGTAPAMLLTPMVMRALTPKTRFWLMRVGGVALMAMGGLTIWRGLAMGMMHHMHGGMA